MSIKFKFSTVFLSLFTVFGAAYAQEIKIIDKPIIYDSTRTKLSLQYLKLYLFIGYPSFR